MEWTGLFCYSCGMRHGSVKRWTPDPDNGPEVDECQCCGHELPVWPAFRFKMTVLGAQAAVQERQERELC